MNKVISILLCILIPLALTGCGNQETATEKDPLVKTQVVALGNGQDSGSYPGVVRGRYETNMSFQLSLGCSHLSFPLIGLL